MSKNQTDEKDQQLDQLLNSNRLSEESISHIITAVIRFDQTISITLEQDSHYKLQWNHEQQEPMLTCSNGEVKLRGILPLYQWLNEQCAITNWHAENKIKHIVPLPRTNKDVSNIVTGLTKDIKKLNAASALAVMHNIQHTKNITAVIAVYDNAKPAHMILEELYEWASSHDPNLVKQIQKLEADMSWNEENPV